MPLCYLSSRGVADLVPVLLGWPSAPGPQLQPADHLVLGDTVPVQDQELEADVLEALVVGDLEHERLVEDRVGGALLHVGLLLGDALVVVEKVDLHVRICVGEKKHTVQMIVE